MVILAIIGGVLLLIYNATRIETVYLLSPVAWVGWIAWHIAVIRMAVMKDYKDFRIALVVKNSN